MVGDFSEAENIAMNTVVFSRCDGQHLSGVCVLLTHKTSEHNLAIKRVSHKHSEDVFASYSKTMP